jgi:hypothetical protein
MATKPSPYTFINDTEGLPNTANVIYTQQNPNNTNTLVANYNDPTLFNNPQLQILNSAGGANGQLQFNNSRGFGGSSNLTYTESTSRLQLRGNLYVTGNLFANIQTNLNNFHLSGGANGYVLTTDGAGNVNWISPDPNTTASLYNGNSNVIVYANGNIAFSSNGVANVVTISNNGINLGSNANVRITGGNATNYLTTDGAGNLYWADDVPIYIGNSAPNLPQGHLWFDNDEGRAYINYDGNSWVDLSPAVMPNPDMYANTITFPDGSVQTTAGGASYGNSNVAAYLPTYTGNVNASNINVSNTAYTYNLSATGLASLTTVDVSGALSVGGNINGSNIIGTIKTASQPNITGLGTLSFLSVAGNVNALANVHAAFFKGNGSQLTGVIATTTATVTTNAQPNITSLGTLSSLSVTGNTRTGNLIVTANTDSIGPSTGSIQTAGGIGAQGNIIGNNHLYVGPGASLTAFTNPIMIGKTTGANFIQSAIINSAETGSTDWVAYGDNGTESGGWSDFGFTSSNFSDPAYTVTGSNDGYFFVQPQSGTYGGNLVLATGNQGTVNDIIFATGGFQTGNIFGRISHSNLTLELPTGNISIGGNITANNLGNISSIDIDGNTSNILYGNGVFAAAPSLNYGDSNVATLLGSFGSNNVSTTGNITSDSLSGSNLFVTYSSGDEGGQISLAQAANSTLDGNTVTVDIYQNKFRIFEQGGNARGVYIDLLQSASSSTTLLNNRLTSAFNTTSNEVTMDSIKVGINGSAIPYVKTVSGSTTFTWTSVFVKYDGISQYVSSGGGGTGITVSTSEQAVGTAFTTAGDSGVVTFMNQSNGQVHRVTYLAGPSNVGTGGGSVIVERLM